jgi:hypothetical protein
MVIAIHRNITFYKCNKKKNSVLILMIGLPVCDTVPIIGTNKNLLL